MNGTRHMNDIPKQVCHQNQYAYSPIERTNMCINQSICLLKRKKSSYCWHCKLYESLLNFTTYKHKKYKHAKNTNALYRCIANLKKENQEKKIHIHFSYYLLTLARYHIYTFKFPHAFLINSLILETMEL